ncbi:hypothetical protein JF66_16025 [Cryobacterium sp. MLB-32]|uniref:alternate-type signal peptide domain-containing protein n=1 Tax=Cryobacterium sp. MLB-32 TaxID=1529318 RepID=UPI0004E65069|nr:alternate-type signal peptide domain-containing protein [Cryobacterium sp. MLB-32]KFF58789.1 hypothetical protein JF66_16025 [Cryobacterium sp. MLB-32]
MNKLIKGSIAGAAGIALLLGGAGTFALWNDSAAVAGGTVVAGELAINSNDNAHGSWYANGDSKSINLSSYTIVPGDTLVFKQTLPVKVTGTNLTATLALTGSSITATKVKVSGGENDRGPVRYEATEASKQLAADLTAHVDVAATGTGISGDAPTYVITTAAKDVNVSVTLHFPEEATDGMLGSVDLSKMTVELQQTILN